MASAAAAVLVVLGAVAWSVRSGTLVDLALFRSAARAVLQGRSPYDVVADVPFVYPPGGFLAALLAAVGGTVSATAWWWGLLSCAALARVIWLLVRLAWPAIDRARVLQRTALLLAASCLLQPTLVTLQLGQVGLLLLWLTVEGAPREPRHDVRTALVGVATAIKLTPAVVLLGIAAAGRWRSVLWGLVGLLATTAVGLVVSPTARSELLGGAWRRPFDVNSGPDVLDHSVPGIVTALGAPTWLGAALALAVLVAGVALAGWAWRRGDLLDGLATALVAGLLASPVSWGHHWVAAYPALVLLLREGRTSRGARALLVTALLGMLTWVDLLGVGEVRTVAGSVPWLLPLHGWTVLWGLAFLAWRSIRQRAARRGVAPVAQLLPFSG